LPPAAATAAAVRRGARVVAQPHQSSPAQARKKTDRQILMRSSRAKALLFRLLADCLRRAAIASAAPGYFCQVRFLWRLARSFLRRLCLLIWLCGVFLVIPYFISYMRF